ncbi:MAG: hypothetical protein RIQ47_761 [Bacteroidota bacterium]|jgi:uncharacterized protein YyaL (SSP411 family)
MSNHLAGETSPYLLQHVNNPVDWYPWCDEAWEKAKTENKLVLVSIGYSACHWCHVMEHESFENEATARIMNDHFVCIKVDREERPDIDQVYMSAVQLMTGQGGWPLNCFTLPDGRPLYGGTYFPNANWNNVLQQLAHLYREDPVKANQYADELTTGMHRSELVKLPNDELELTPELLKETVEKWKRLFDAVEGGPNRAPKFPLPNNYEFLLHYQSVTKDPSLLQHIELTLDKMAYGGIYDQIGGGFARYSVDSEWKVPHFEKMLYDNAQLVSLYAQAFKYIQKPLYREIVTETLAFIDRELTAPQGVCYSALDADSEGEEGKFYTWTAEELAAVDFPPFKNYDTRKLFCEYYSVNGKGLWEHGKNILLRTMSDEVFAAKHAIPLSDWLTILQQCKSTLLNIRSKRIRPGLDNKILTSWNALMITGWCDAFDSTGEIIYLDRAIKAANWLLSNMRNDDGSLLHAGTVDKQKGPGFLEDYALLAQALLSLYRSTFDEQWLQSAESLFQYTIEHFSDPDTGLCWFTSDLDPKLVTRKIEVHDNVLPAANSVLAKVMFQLGHLLGKSDYISRARMSLLSVAEDMPRYGAAYSNWGQLALWFTHSFYELAVTGAAANNEATKLRKVYLPNVLLAGCVDESSKLPLLIDRYSKGTTLFYVCTSGACQLPATTFEEAIQQVKH